MPSALARAARAKRLRAGAWVASAVLCVALTTRSARSQEVPVFGASTDLTVRTVTVVDRNGRPIEGLSANDFVVTENGVRQKVELVAFQRLAGEPLAFRGGSPRQEETDGPGEEPAGGPAGGGARRLLVFYFDSASLVGDADKQRAVYGALEFVRDGMHLTDLVAIYTHDGDAVRLRVDFTSDRASLQDALAAYLVRDERAGLDAAFGQNAAEFNVFNTNRQLSALQTLVAGLQGRPEQKTLMYFGSGLRLNPTENVAQLRATINAAVRANVTINPIDTRGLVATPPLGDASRRSPGGIGMFTGAFAQTASREFQGSQDTLHALANDTGGRAWLDSNDLGDGIARAAAAVTSYYLIGYTSTHVARDGRFRRVQVALADGRDARLSYREGYYAAKEFAKFSAEERERQLEEAFMLEDPITEINLAVEANYFQVNSAEYFVPVAVKIPGNELALARRRGAARTELDVIGEVRDEFGLTIQNVRDRIELRLDQATADQLAGRPVHYETGLSLLPGRYVVKLLVRDITTGRIGTFITPVQVPNLVRETMRLPMSSVVLAWQRAPIDAALFQVRQAAGSRLASPLVHGNERWVPSVTRTFSAGRDLEVVFQVYQRPATEAALSAYVTFYRDGHAVMESRPVWNAQPPTGRAAAVTFRITVPLDGLEPGRYECQVTVIDAAEGRAGFWQAPILIVP